MFLPFFQNGFSHLCQKPEQSYKFKYPVRNYMWWIYALLSAFFAALTAIFAKIGIKGVDTDLATAIRTVVILLLAWGIAIFRGGANTIGGLNKMNWIFLILSGFATGLSWICYFKALQLGEVSQVAPVDKLSVAIAIILA